MHDIVEWFQGLETWQKIALVGGGLGLILLIWRPWRSTGSAEEMTEASFTTPAAVGYSYAGPYDVGSNGGDAGSSIDVLDELADMQERFTDALAAALATSDAAAAAAKKENDAAAAAAKKENAAAIAKLKKENEAALKKQESTFTKLINTLKNSLKPSTTTSSSSTTKKKYTVKKGDTLSGIAKKLGIKDWKTLYNANKKTIGSNANLIKPGQVLYY